MGIHLFSRPYASPVSLATVVIGGLCREPVCGGSHGWGASARNISLGQHWVGTSFSLVCRPLCVSDLSTPTVPLHVWRTCTLCWSFSEFKAKEWCLVLMCDPTTPSHTYRRPKPTEIARALAGGPICYDKNKQCSHGDFLSGLLQGAVLSQQCASGSLFCIFLPFSWKPFNSCAALNWAFVQCLISPETISSFC